MLFFCWYQPPRNPLFLKLSFKFDYFYQAAYKLVNFKGNCCQMSDRIWRATPILWVELTINHQTKYQTIFHIPRSDKISLTSVCGRRLSDTQNMYKSAATSFENCSFHYLQQHMFCFGNKF